MGTEPNESQAETTKPPASAKQPEKLVAAPWYLALVWAALGRFKSKWPRILFAAVFIVAATFYFKDQRLAGGPRFVPGTVVVKKGDQTANGYLVVASEGDFVFAEDLTNRGRMLSLSAADLEPKTVPQQMPEKP